MSTGFADEQRLAFGRVAELYDRARPSYPEAAVDDVMEHARLRAGERVLEIGAGTGKLTVLLARRGLRVLAVEPSPTMAALARADCEGLTGVEVIEQEFERFEPPGSSPAVVAAAAWHWIDPAVRYRRAYEALAEGGTLAGLWTFPDWSHCTLRARLSDAYHRAVPEMAPDFPMHPGSRPETLVGARRGRVRGQTEWEAEIASTAGAFVDPRTRLHAWSSSYTTSQYTDLLQTHQDHILLAPESRARLLSAVAGAIDGAAGRLELPLVTYVCLARRGSAQAHR